MGSSPKMGPDRFVKRLPDSWPGGRPEREQDGTWRKQRRVKKMTSVLSVKNLRKRYGDLMAVDGVSFEVGRNEIVGLLGPNGAGKTTTINMILGILEPTSG